MGPVIASGAKQSLLSCRAVPNPRLPRRFAPRNDIRCAHNDKPAPRITEELHSILSFGLQKDKDWREDNARCNPIKSERVKINGDI
jgi:hypothetical protein